ncbi:MAG: hypothetical protein COW76_17325 [Shewanella sp. CG18_big_fil_WC_8_21_14_2_50_42_11]|jgi:hypothetical protein|nr:MAG: hypothetical protein COW76_17325 [Shewanella sp. CG18_big_fil_WC_8_21_14_2_50_42_11]PIX69743.1 MAG: hypothetical protein COZ42_17815 [Shewanella sp. CG_4_10_14_3_um_filter_42_91]PIY63732.1 MAG: hypothetical protein COY92_20195 [Shewanella sp. CG_4_10_14_0_8_um_filter_42_13]PJB89811.1 MAG: hypothetical protein CO084_19990 [Shewanella sp. CG_4_9_14_0_8_um_filter_42_14]|tara:strand:- start:377 stop:568 length:192 start_codon:yes stop_codon:yes gene_type:complete
MMKSLIKKLLGRSTVPKRNKVHIDMRYEEHSYKSNQPFNDAKPNSIDIDDIATEVIKQKPTKK